LDRSTGYNYQLGYAYKLLKRNRFAWSFSAGMLHWARLEYV